MKRLILLFLAFQISFSQDVKKMEKLYQEFLLKAYNFEFTEAEKLADKIIEDFPNSPYGYHGKSMLTSWYYFGTRKKEYVKIFLKYSDLSVAKFEAWQENKSSSELLFRLGEHYSYKGILLIISEENLDAFWNIKKAIGFFEESLEQNPKFYDANTGIGVFSITLSMAPSFVKTALSTLGFNSDAEEGIKQLKLAAKYGEISKIEANYQLGKAYSDFYNDQDSSNIYLNSLTKQFPKNIFFKYQLAVNKIKQKKYAESEKILLELINSKSNEMVQIVAFSHFLFAEIKFFQNNYDGAIKHYNFFFDKTQGINFLGYANYKIAQSFLMKENQKKAEEYLFLAQNGEEYNTKDIEAKRISLNLIESKNKDFNKNLVFAQNALEMNKWEDAIKLIENIKLDGNEANQQKNLILGESNYYLGKTALAENFLKKAIQLKSKNNNHLARAYLNLVKISLKNEKRSQAKKYFEEAIDLEIVELEIKSQLLGISRKHRL